MEIEKYAPIALFVYKRPNHTKSVIEALLKNKEAKDSILYVFADGAKKDDIFLMNSFSYINGFTTNPTLMRKAGISSYENLKQR
jgi:transaldolase